MVKTGETLDLEIAAGVVVVGLGIDGEDLATVGVEEDSGVGVDLVIVEVGVDLETAEVGVDVEDSGIEEAVVVGEDSEAMTVEVDSEVEEITIEVDSEVEGIMIEVDSEEVEITTEVDSENHGVEIGEVEEEAAVATVLTKVLGAKHHKTRKSLLINFADLNTTSIGMSYEYN